LACEKKAAEKGVPCQKEEERKREVEKILVVGKTNPPRVPGRGFERCAFKGEGTIASMYVGARLTILKTRERESAGALPRCGEKSLQKNFLEEGGRKAKRSTRDPEAQKKNPATMERKSIRIK